MRLLPALLLLGFLPAQQAQTFKNGLPDDPAFFPIGVWLQSPHNAKRYQDVGINLYVGLYEGPTKEQLETLGKVGMRTFCAQNAAGLAYAARTKNKTIIGWMHDDEPDNAQHAAFGFGPPTKPWKVVEGFEAMRKADPTRPVLLNLGQGAAWNGWHGRGTRTNHPEDYPEYLKGCDIGSFDIYPVTHTHRDVAGKLEFVGNGVRRMRQWSNDRKPIFACIETGHVDNKNARPTAEQVRAEVWIAIACGAKGVIYFAHEFAPKFVEAGFFQYPDVTAAVQKINAEIASFAEVLNGPTLTDIVAVSNKPDADIAVLGKRDGEAIVVFAVSMTSEPVKATFKMSAGKKSGNVTVLGEKRSLPLKNGRFTDRFAGYAVHHYRVPRE